MTNNIKLTKSVIFSCFFAGCLEMYDFVIFGFLAPIINKNYLSFLDEKTGIVITYLLFAVGFICRPIGAIIFGYIGDRYGRKKALITSVSLMGIASISMSLLPPYAEIGIISCYLIALIRIIQGISVGGEYSGAAIYAMEHTNKANIGVIGSTVLTGTNLGVLMATLVSNLLDNPNLPEYSWRFAFLLGFGLTIIGYFIRQRLGESPLFAQEKQIHTTTIPLLYGLRKFKKEFLAGVLLSGSNNANYYFALVFIPSYLKSGVEKGVEFNNLYLGFFIMFLEPTFGWLSDKLGRGKILIWVCTALAVYNIFFLDLLINYSSTSFAILFIMLSAILISMSVSTVNISVIEIFPVNCRYSCGALSYSIGAALFGGTTPLICSLITKHIGNKPIYFGMYVSLISIFGAIAAYLLLHSKKQKKEIKGVIIT